MKAASRNGGGDRGRPRLWHYDYLHLRPLALDLRERISRTATGSALRRILDIGCGPSPYRRYFGNGIAEYVRFDASPEHSPMVIGFGEAIPFPDGAFDAVLMTQAICSVQDPRAAGREVARVLREGGTAWITTPLAWPYGSAAPEHRFGVPDLPGYLPGLTVTEILPQGGMLGLIPSLSNLIVREAVRAAERRIGAPARLLRLPAAAVYLVSNGAGRCLEGLARRGPLARFLGYLDGLLPMNLMLVAEKRGGSAAAIRSPESAGW